MPSKLIMTKGLPGSGKSTWAKQMVEESGFKRVNKDDLRAMIDGGKWSKANEKFILNIRDRIVQHALLARHNIIVDDTNLHPKHEENLRAEAKSNGAEFKIKDFTDVPLQTCIERDLLRQVSVGKDVILKMHREFLKDKSGRRTPEYNHTLPNCIIVDIDGTLAINDGHRQFYEWDKVGLDKPNKPVVNLVRYCDDLTTRIIVFSGRDGSCIDLSREWLIANEIPFDALYQRASGDSRKDNIVKRELYDAHVLGVYNVLFVLDDRNQVVDMWRNELGLTCLQVAEGNF